MISTVRLWETLMQSAKTGTAGYQTAAEFNRDLASVQTSLMGLLCPQYAVNSYVQELLFPFVRSVAISLVKPTDCFYFLGATVNGVPSYPIDPTQASIYATSSIRKPSASNRTAYHYLINGAISYLYHGAFTGTMDYIRTPAESTITLTPVSSADRDYVTASSSSDLEWPESAFNFILAMMQQKLGIELKESLQIQMGQAGIQFEIQKV